MARKKDGSLTKQSAARMLEASNVLDLAGSYVSEVPLSKQRPERTWQAIRPGDWRTYQAVDFDIDVLQELIATKRVEDEWGVGVYEHPSP